MSTGGGGAAGLEEHEEMAVAVTARARAARMAFMVKFRNGFKF
jgi:hypothetical protein